MINREPPPPESRPLHRYASGIPLADGRGLYWVGVDGVAGSGWLIRLEGGGGDNCPQARARRRLRICQNARSPASYSSCTAGGIRSSRAWWNWRCSKESWPESRARGGAAGFSRDAVGRTFSSWLARGQTQETERGRPRPQEGSTEEDLRDLPCLPMPGRFCARDRRAPLRPR